MLLPVEKLLAVEDSTEDSSPEDTFFFQEAYCMPTPAIAKAEELPLKTYIPEQRLLFAVLERAFRDLKDANPAIRRETETWFFGEVSKTDSWSLVWILSEINLLHAMEAVRKFAKDICSWRDSALARNDLQELSKPIL